LIFGKLAGGQMHLNTPMPDFLKLLATEADVKLTDKRNYAVNDLLSNIYQIDNNQIHFKITHSVFWDGIATISNTENVNAEVLFNVYISKKNIYVALFTLDLVKLIDVPYRIFIAELKILMSE
jgi:hypothetical protein